MEIIQQEFGRIGEQTVTSFTLKNENGVVVTAINYGCIITKILVPDTNGNYENIVIGHDSLEDYMEDPVFLGAVVGRVAGRIRGGAFEMDGKAYTLPQNNGPNHLHGGLQGFNKVVWQADVLEDGVRFTYLSKDGEEGYPGNLHAAVTYTLDDHNQLKIRYEAQTDKKTVVTLTNHSYFNLSGSLKRDVLHHTLTLKSNEYLELDEEFIPTGRLLNVDHTPFDLRDGASIEIGANSSHPQTILAGRGYDHPFVLNTNQDREIRLEDPESGRVLTVETDEPAVVVYSGNSLDGAGPFRGTPGAKHLGICLETQGFPDAVHQPGFPSIVLKPNEKYTSATTYTFGIQ
ncbi:galactose mutarotase [Rossellomorea vietnamensis]|uniref:Aldose 1-epimerase n=1 Tax=Rossellomorea vietnamensis TaxID=218284 RepID=A0A5D4NXA4_9BACI|nr:aldose epimerase family protein [Rossellomorea vietnamensis]TYS18560.1 galactose mutarotase [Rossellomorea vietnamensis]